MHTTARSRLIKKELSSNLMFTGPHQTSPVLEGSSTIRLSLGLLPVKIWRVRTRCIKLVYLCLWGVKVLSHDAILTTCFRKKSKIAIYTTRKKVNYKLHINDYGGIICTCLVTG